MILGAVIDIAKLLKIAVPEVLWKFFVWICGWSPYQLLASNLIVATCKGFWVLIHFTIK